VSKTLLHLAALILLLAPAANADAPSPIHAVESRASRTFGLVIGDVLEQEIRVRVETGYRLDTAQLPQPGGAVDDFLEIRRSDWSEQNIRDETLYRIVLRYQIFKGVRKAETLEVPALPLFFQRGDHAVETRAPAWRFTLSPIIPPEVADEQVTLADTLPAPEGPSAPEWFKLAAWCAALAGLLLYAAWRLEWPPFSRRDRPCAAALRALKKLRAAPLDAAAFRQAVRLVHAALDRTAGYTLFPDRLAYFLDEHPAYAAHGAELEEFFALSETLFFAPDRATWPEDSNWRHLEALCRGLRQAERSEARKTAIPPRSPA
jgi:mxaA protein